MRDGVACRMKQTIYLQTDIRRRKEPNAAEMTLIHVSVDKCLNRRIAAERGTFPLYAARICFKHATHIKREFAAPEQKQIVLG